MTWVGFSTEQLRIDLEDLAAALRHQGRPTVKLKGWRPISHRDMGSRSERRTQLTRKKSSSCWVMQR